MVHVLIFGKDYWTWLIAQKAFLTQHCLSTPKLCILLGQVPESVVHSNCEYRSLLGLGLTGEGASGEEENVTEMQASDDQGYTEIGGFTFQINNNGEL